MTTLLQFCDRLAKNVGLAAPDSVYSSSQREWQEALEFANEEGRELLRRFDWSDLYAEDTVTGDGTSAGIALPSDYDRMARGVSVRYSGAILRPLTQKEWGGLTAVEGTPRYYLIDGDTIKFWPYLANLDTATIGYIKNDWCTNGASFGSDADTVVYPDDVFGLGLIVRWRRQKGMDYADFEAEYEAALTQQAKFDRNTRL